MINGKHGQRTHSTKMGDNKSAENTPKNFSSICLPKLKSLGFSKKSVRSPCSIQFNELTYGLIWKLRKMYCMVSTKYSRPPNRRKCALIYRFCACARLLKMKCMDTMYLHAFKYWGEIRLRFVQAIWRYFFVQSRFNGLRMREHCRFRFLFGI